jgi:hypothetical protein
MRANRQLVAWIVGAVLSYGTAVINGALQACPIITIPNGTELVYRGDWRAAWIVFTRQIIFLSSPAGVPGPLRRVVRPGHQQNSPSPSSGIEQTIIDKGFEAGWVLPDPQLLRTAEASRSSWIRTGWIGLRQPA